MERNEKNWFVVMCKPNQEDRAIKNLRNQNFDAFSPYFETEKLNGKIGKIVKEFLFPSYIFVKFNLSNYQWLKIRYTQGVKKVLSIGSIPSQIDKSFIENLRFHANNDGLINKQIYFFKPSSRVIIVKGPFKRMFGEIISMVGNNRIKILLDFISNKKTLVLEKDCILPN